MFTLKEDVASLLLDRVQDTLKVCSYDSVDIGHLHSVFGTELQVGSLLGKVDDPVVLVLDDALHLVHL